MRLSGCLLFILYLISTSGFGQIKASSAIFTEQTGYLPADPVYFFSSIQMQSLSCEGPGSLDTYSFVWTKHNSADNSWTQSVQSGTGNSSAIIISEPGGYQVRITGTGTDVTYRCWAFEPSLNNTLVYQEEESCTKLDLRAVSDTLPMVYYYPSGNEEFIKYNREYSWTASTGTSIPEGAFISIDAPVEDTDFDVIVTDKFGNNSSSSLDYTAIAVLSLYESEEVKADVPQEVHSTTEGSAPIEIRFTDQSKGNITSWEWRFGDSGVSNEQNPFYVFTTVGKDTVYLTVVNQLSGCESICEDPLIVIVMESMLEVPNAFTPNDDGANDEFRVVYRSIKKYHIVVFNRWGRKVYESTNPAEGWNGSIGGSVAPPGVYFYYIEAEGYQEGEKHTRNGPIHLIRGK